MNEEELLPGATAIDCPLCGYHTDEPRPQDVGFVQGNTARFKDQRFALWKCPECQTIVALEPVDFADIYTNYPLNKRRLDAFARGTLANLLRRLTSAGLNPSHSILDYGSGNNIFVDYLRQRGYAATTGYDPYVSEHARLPDDRIPFDVVVNNDTLEHCEDLRGMLTECLGLLKPGGLLYLGTADSAPVDMTDLEPEVMRLHQPYHRIILTEDGLHQLVSEFDVDIVGAYTRSYHDTLRPFSNYRFLDEMNTALGHDLDLAMDPKVTTRTFLRTPRLWFFAFFGYWFPSAVEPAVIVQKRG